MTNPDITFGSQILGIVSVGIFVSAVSAILWYVMKMTIGIRVTPEAEIMGLDRSELGMDAYPEFTKN